MEYSSYSKNEDRFEFRTVGTFRCANKNEMLLCAVILPPLFILLTLAATMIAGLTILGMDVLAFILLMVVVVMIVITVFRCITGGVEYHYKADSQRFTVISPKGEETVFVYSDVKGVYYKEKHLFTKERGYTVTIFTTDDMVVYEYIYSKNKLLRDTTGTPFYIIEERAGLVDRDKGR